MYNLAVTYEKGYGIAQDLAKARELYEESAAKGAIDTDAEALGQARPNRRLVR